MRQKSAVVNFYVFMPLFNKFSLKAPHINQNSQRAGTVLKSFKKTRILSSGLQIRRQD